MIKFKVMNMTEAKFDNFWTKLGLSKLRGNKVFKGVWRAVRVGIVAGVFFFVKSVLPELEIVPDFYLPLIAAGVEKIIRELFPGVDF